MSEIPSYANVDYRDGADESPEDYPTMPAKLDKAHAVLERALSAYRRPAIMWTGGKDSTLALYLLLEAAEASGADLPPAIFIDHFQHFPEVREFVERWADRWGLEVRMARNDDVGAYVREHGLEPGDEIPIEALSAHNQHHVRRILEHDEPTFRFLLDTYVGNHLLKTVALNDTLEAHGFDAIISGVRWDEQEARADETFFSARHDPEIYPPHDRVHPILPFTERDVWQATWEHVVPGAVDGYPGDAPIPASADDLPDGVEVADLPVSSMYFAGYRSLGSQVSTERSADEPAWIQDLEGTTERAGRAQDKENLMQRLRDLGYM